MRLQATAFLSPCSTSYGSVAPPAGRRLVQPVRCSGMVSEDGSLAQQQRRPLVVKSQPVARQAAPPPQPVPVEHSSAYLLRNRQSAADDAAAYEQRRRQQQEAFNGSALEWVLRKADESLDEIEENPPEHVRVLYDISNGPIGKAASSTVTTAARVTVEVGTEALKAAAPVGKWALQQGFKLAVGAVSKGLTSAVAGDKKGGGSAQKKQK